METTKQFQIQDFLLSITYQNSLLHLEAKETSSKRIFTVSIDSDAIAQITNGLFDSAESLTQGFRDATSGSSQGKLTYTIILSVGTRKREDSFSINLAEKELKQDPQDSNHTIEKWKEEHEIKVSNLEGTLDAFQRKNEEKFNKLENMMLQMEQKISQRFDALEKVYGALHLQVLNLQKEDLKKPGACFNNFSFNKSSYHYNPDHKTVKLLEGAHRCLEIVPEIPQNGLHSYSFIINKKTSAMMFGITTERNRENWNDARCNSRFGTGNGQIYGRVAK